MRTISKLMRFVRRHRDDERGAVLILTSMCMILLLGAGALGVDLGFTVWGSRSAQAMADTAALDLAQYIPSIDAQPNDSQMKTYIAGLLAAVDKDNGSNSVLSATPGLWYDNTFTPGNIYFANGCSGTVFTTPPGACNAIQVTANQTVPQPFWGGFISPSGNSRGSGSGPCTHNCGNIAVFEPEAGFSIGSYLFNLATVQQTQMPLDNTLLDKLGASANITAVGYQGLADTYVSLNQLIAASGSVLTPSNIMTTSLNAQNWANLFYTTANNQGAQLGCGSSPPPAACAAATALSASAGQLTFSGTPPTAELCQMLSINGSTCSNPFVSMSDLNAEFSLLQVLTTEAELANGTNGLVVTSALGGLTGVLSANLSLYLIQPAQSAYGPVGSYTAPSPCPAPSGQTSTCAMTDQFSNGANPTEGTDLNLTVLDGLNPVTIDIPLSAAVGYATLFAVNCSNNVLQSVTVDSSTTTASASVTENGTSIGTIKITGVAARNGQIPFSNVSPNGIPPNSYTESNGTNPKNITNSTGNPPSVTFTPNTGTVLDSTLTTVINGLTGGVLGAILQATGASVGGASVTASSGNCDAVQLVS